MVLGTSFLLRIGPSSHAQIVRAISVCVVSFVPVHHAAPGDRERTAGRYRHANGRRRQARDFRVGFRLFLGEAKQVN